MTSSIGWNRETSPFHSGELEIQARLGKKEQLDKAGRSAFRPYMPDQHREFFNQLPFMVIGSVDVQGWPWASIIFGRPGFITSPTNKKLVFNKEPLPGDPLNANLEEGAPLGLLGIELPTRRRNRMNGLVGSLKSGVFEVNVVQSFGNCPQYIQTRAMQFIRDPAVPFETEVDSFTELDLETKNLIQSADTFFVASHNNRDDKTDTGGVDVSHRGGQPGFVKVEDNELTIPDFIGNYIFNTLGNFLINPRAGLIFIDFETGDIVMLTGTVEIIWELTPEIKAFKGGERAWRFKLDHGRRLRKASPLRWTFGEASPNTLRTGNWTDATKRLELENRRKSWLPYQVVRIVDESYSIRSFYLEPDENSALFQHDAGQFLTIRVRPEHSETPFVRTYTLSSAPTDSLYRISIKKDGVVSNFLHQHIKPGDKIEARAPIGSFVLDTQESRPAVLLGAGVGITPMISMARQAVSEGLSRRHIRPLTIVHAARNQAERPFRDEFTDLEKQAEGRVTYISLLSQPEISLMEGTDFYAAGRLSQSLLQNILPLDDYDFFLCGPAGFIQSSYDILMELGVPDRRIFSEAFGPSVLIRRQDATSVKGIDSIPRYSDVATIEFTKSKFEQMWTPEDGSLLEFAENHGLTPAFGCRTGNCGSCVARIKSGQIIYKNRPEFETDDGEILLCCAVPAKDTERLQLDL